MYVLAIGINWILILHLTSDQVELNKHLIELLLFENVMLLIRFSLSFMKYTLSLWCSCTDNDFRTKFTLFPIIKNSCLVLTIVIMLFKFSFFVSTISTGSCYDYFVRITRYFRKYWTNKSLKLKVQKLPVVAYTDSNEICIICLQKMHQGKELPCKHVFHIHCLEYLLS
jgi:hypothetical protein